MLILLIMKTSIFRSIRFKIAVLFAVFGIVLVGLVYVITLSMVTRMEETLIASRLKADINYIEDLIGKGDWNVRDGAIYLGDTLVGDGTHEKANLAPFLEHEDKTGTFSYVFIKCGDEGLGYVEATPTQRAYYEGHYLRVAGSTRDPNGKSIVGTYMDILVADVLDSEGTYGGEANVAGGMIYCRYDTLKDTSGQVVGAIVVGRNVSELQAQVHGVMRTLIIAVIAVVFLTILVMLFIVSRWTRVISRVTNYISEIENGKIPFDDLPQTDSNDEIGTLVSGVNRMTESLRETESLRKKSETDHLTGLANRFGLTHFAEEIFEDCYRSQKPIMVGIMDIDFFKPYNDHYGHQAGDACILMIADILKEAEQYSGVRCARFGGDEFVLMASGLGQEGVMRLAQRIATRVKEIHRKHEFSDAADYVTVSQGYVFGVPMPHQRLNDYIHIADGALYDVKKNTKNDFKIVQMTGDFRPSIDNKGIVSEEFDAMT